MALTPNTWYVVTWTTPIPANVPPWGTGTGLGIHPVILDAILGATSMLIFCVANGATTDAIQFAGLGNTQIDIPNTGVVTVAGTPAMNTQTMDDGSTWYSTRNGGINWYCYTTAGYVFTLTNSAALGAFIS